MRREYFLWLFLFHRLFGLIGGLYMIENVDHHNGSTGGKRNEVCIDIDD